MINLMLDFGFVSILLLGVAIACGLTYWHTEPKPISIPLPSSGFVRKRNR